MFQSTPVGPVSKTYLAPAMYSNMLRSSGIWPLIFLLFILSLSIYSYLFIMPVLFFFILQVWAWRCSWPRLRLSCFLWLFLPGKSASVKRGYRLVPFALDPSWEESAWKLSEINNHDEGGGGGEEEEEEDEHYGDGDEHNMGYKLWWK